MSIFAVLMCDLEYAALIETRTMLAFLVDGNPIVNDAGLKNRLARMTPERRAEIAKEAASRPDFPESFEERLRYINRILFPPPPPPACVVAAGITQRQWEIYLEVQGMISARTAKRMTPEQRKARALAGALARAKKYETGELPRKHPKPE